MKTKTIRQRGPAALTLIPALALLMLLGAGCADKEATAPQDSAPVEQMAEPEAIMPEPEMAEPEAAPPAATAEPAAEAADTQAAAADGQKVYTTACQVCHAAGVAGAPKLGDKDAWAPRIAKGNDALLSSVKNGLNAMPPKGGCMTCSDDELNAAVLHMVEQGS